MDTSLSFFSHYQVLWTFLGTMFSLAAIWGACFDPVMLLDGNLWKLLLISYTLWILFVYAIRWKPLFLLFRLSHKHDPTEDRLMLFCTALFDLYVGWIVAAACAMVSYHFLKAVGISVDPWLLIACWSILPVFLLLYISRDDKPQMTLS